jgi:phage shock protein PspC (stress-responsive transcriptional regulator)
MTKLAKTDDDRFFFGVCGGIARRMGISSLWPRLAFVLALIFFGAGILLYLILAILMPSDSAYTG